MCAYRVYGGSFYYNISINTYLHVLLYKSKVK